MTKEAGITEDAKIPLIEITEDEGQEIFDRILHNSMIAGEALDTIPKKENTAEDMQFFFDTVLGLLTIVKRQYREELAAALEQFIPGQKTALSQRAEFLGGAIIEALQLDPTREYVQSLADLLGLPAERLLDIGKMTKEYLKDEFLPGLEPTQEEAKAKRMEIIQQQRIAYNLITKRGTSKIDRKAGYMLNTLDNETTFALDIRGSDPIEKTKDVIRVKWNAPYDEKGEQLRVTPFDQEVETVISNFFDEGHPAITTEQIYYAMTGLTADTGKPNKQILQEIEKSIMKLNTIPVSIRRIENGTTRKEENGSISVEGGNETIIAEYGTILDTAKTGYVEIQGKHRLAWISTRRGYLYSTEKMLGRLISIKREALNLLSSGISFTVLSFILRRFCFIEMSRFSTTASYAVKDNKFLLDNMYLYEADPELVEISSNMQRKLKTGETSGEQAKIRNAKKRRRDTLQKLLQHFKAKGAIIDWDFCQGDKKLPYTEEKDPSTNDLLMKRIYKGTADSVYIKVEKSGRTISRISNIERRIETAEKNQRRAKNETKDKG